MRVFLPIILAIVLTIVVSLALMIGISLGIGWILTLFLPFSLFEGTLLGIIAVLATASFWYNLLRSVPPFGWEEEEEDFEREEEAEIPPSRFWKKSADRTWKKWLEYVLANSIYEDLLDSPRGMGGMQEKQLQELAVRLAKAAVMAVQTKSPRAKRLRVSRKMLKQAMAKMGQRPYDDELLDIAVEATNIELVYLGEELREVIRDRLWDEPTEMF